MRPSPLWFSILLLILGHEACSPQVAGSLLLGRVSSLSELCSSSLSSTSLSAADGSLMTYTRAAKGSWVHGVELEWVLDTCGRAGDKMALEVSWSLMLPKFSEDRWLVNTHLFIYWPNAHFTLKSEINRMQLTLISRCWKSREGYINTVFNHLADNSLCSSWGGHC